MGVSRISLYDELGGEDVVEALVEHFYDIIEQDEEAAELHLLHMRGHGVAHSRVEQFMFMSGFFGGPQLYVQRHGTGSLRQIHEHVPIGPKMRDLWLACMEKAVDRVAIAEPQRSKLMAHLTRAAEISRNRDED